MLCFTSAAGLWACRFLIFNGFERPERGYLSEPETVRFQDLRHAAVTDCPTKPS